MRRVFLVLSAAVMIVIIFAVPVISQMEAAMGCQELETYMVRQSTAKADIVFVFDTSNSMGSEIREMRNICKIFADGLVDMDIDYRLGLTAFRDFPVTCGEGENKIFCGKPYDFPYEVYNDGTLTDNYLTFKSWLNQLSAGGGGDDPEAILAALRHTATDIQWREGDVEKVIVLITDAPPHSEGDCCNVEGDTLEGVISTLTSAGIRTYTIGPDINSLEDLCFETGGKFYEIRSDPIRPVLEEVTNQIVLTFDIATEITPKHNRLKVKVDLLGKENEEIPYIEGLTQAWMYLKYANGTSRRYEFAYDSATKSYHAIIEPVSGFVELTLYGKVCGATSVETVKFDCRDDNQPPVLINLNPDSTSPQEYDTDITWTANATDPEGDTVFYSFWLKGPSTGDIWQDQTGWMKSNLWTWGTNISDLGQSQIKVNVIDIVHAGRSSWDDQRVVNYTIIGHPPVLTHLNADKISPQEAKTAITWNASAVDPERDLVYFSFWLKGPSTGDTWQDQTGWTSSDLWTWSTTISDIGPNQIKANIRDGVHAGPESWDDQKIINYTITNRAPALTGFNPDKPRPQKVGAAITWTASAIDPEKDTIFYKFLMKGPSTNGEWKEKSGWSENNRFTWSTTDFDTGATKFEVRIRDANNAGPDSWDDRIIARDYVITRWKPTWEKNFGGSEMDGSYSVQQTSDSGYIITGSTYSYGPGGDFWLIKTDPEGNEMWNRTLGGSHYERSISVQLTRDGGYIIAGGTFSYGAGEMDVWLVKTDPLGNEKWNRTFGGPDGDFGVSVQQTHDSGYIITGMTESYSTGDEDVWLIKTDYRGNKKWDKTFGGSDRDEGESVQQTSDGGYIIAGVSESFGAGGADVWIIKTDPKGNREWDKTFGGDDDDMSWSVQETEDEGFIIAGWTASFGAGGKDIWLIKTDSQGNKEWDRTFGGYADDRASSLLKTCDGGYIIAGGTFSFGAGKEDFWLVKTDYEGNVEWERTFGGYGYDVSWSVQETSDGGYISTGWTTSFGIDDNDEDVFLIKTDSVGDVRTDKTIIF